MLRRHKAYVLLLLALGCVQGVCSAQDTWQSVLSGMPLRPAVAQLNRTNCVQVMLRSFQSNEVIKALIFMPGATDEFYMFRRAEAQLDAASPSLLDVVAALTNQTRIRVNFRRPFLLLHTASDPLEPIITIKNSQVAERLTHQVFLSHVEFNDTEWDKIQPLLKRRLGMDIEPWRNSADSDHFYRSALSGWNLTEWEMIEALALANRTRATVEKRPFPRGTLIKFECDMRVGRQEF